MAKKRNTDITIHSSAAEYLTYVASTGDTPESYEMRYENENIWLTQRMMAELYGVDVRTVNDHLKKCTLTSSCEKRQLSENTGLFKPKAVVRCRGKSIIGSEKPVLNRTIRRTKP